MDTFFGIIGIALLSFLAGFAASDLTHLSTKSRICVKGIVYKKVDGVYQEYLESGKTIKCVEDKKGND